MPPRDADALAVWDARARTLIDRIDAVIGGNGATVADEPPAHPIHELVRRVIDRTSAPAGEIITPEPVHRDIDPPRAPSAQHLRPAPTTGVPTNMEHQPDRIDHWDAYVCRFDGDGTGEPDRPTP